MTTRKLSFLDSSLTEEQWFQVWGRAARWHREVIRALHPLGITPAQYAVLRALVRLSGKTEDALRQRALVDETDLSASLVSQALRALGDRGLVDCGINGVDARASRLLCTAKGRKLLEQAKPLVDAATRAAAKNPTERPH